MLSREERARQFLPFDALNGFYKVLQEKEIERIEKIELTDEQIEEISQKLNMIDNDTVVKLIYYADGKYSKIEGKVSKLDTIKKKLVINDITVRFIDILEIKI